MCNLYSIRKSQDELRNVVKGMRDTYGNMPPLPEVYPDYEAPVIRRTDGQLELMKMRWGFPSPPQSKERWTTNVRNTESKWWQPWLFPNNRCLVPATSFCEYSDVIDFATKKKAKVWFGLSPAEPLFFFAGIWREWSGARGPKKAPIEGDHLLYSILTTEPNAVVAPVHRKAMPVILTNWGDCETWLNAPAHAALELQRPLPDDELEIVPAPPVEAAA